MDRNLRFALLFLPASVERPKIMLITSAMPGEGKSTIAANLARTLALGGSRVVLSMPTCAGDISMYYWG